MDEVRDECDVRSSRPVFLLKAESLVGWLGLAVVYR